MGYTKHSRAVTKVLNFLDEMVAAGGKGQIEWAADHPRQLAHAIREGIAVAQRFAAEHNMEPFLSYANLKSLYLLREGVNKVIAEPRNPTPMMVVRVSAPKLRIPECRNALEIVGAAIKHAQHTMVFPDATNDKVMLARVYSWTEKNGYNMELTDEGLVLTRDAINGRKWIPAELVTEVK